MGDKTKDRIELIRAITRALAFLIPLSALCGGLFVLDGIQDTVVGAVITLAVGASVFYYKKSEDA